MLKFILFIKIKVIFDYILYNSSDINLSQERRMFMCEKYERIFRGVTKDYFQWCILWLPFDKIRPGIIISNNWFIKTQKTILAIPLTSRDKSDELYPEFNDNFIPLINVFGKLNYTNIVDRKDLIF